MQKGSSAHSRVIEDQEGEVQSGAELVLVFEVREDFLTVGTQRKIFLVHK